MSFPAPSPITAENQSVHSLELFFDLVFVFAVSQLSKLVAEPQGWTDYLQAGLVFLGVTWMYSAFVWLTNSLRLEDSELQRWNLLLGMICFFGMAMGIPHLARGNGTLFSLSLLSAVVVHLLTFGRLQSSSATAFAQLAPFNLATGVLIVFAAFAPAPWAWYLWALAVLTLFFPIFLRRDTSAFNFRARHFVERHGLMLIIALGEGIVALGTGGGTQGFSAGLAGYVLVGLMLLATLWWVYFGMNQAAAEHRLVHASPADQTRLARHFNSVHSPLLAGTILVAAALEVGSHHPLQAATRATAWNMSVGLSLYFIGLILLRRRLNLPTHLHLWAGGLLTLLTAPIALFWGALWQVLVAVVTMLMAGFSKLPQHKHA